LSFAAVAVFSFILCPFIHSLSFLFEPIDLEKSFKPSLELKRYMRRATQKEKKMLELREIRMAAYATK
jgi:hypothetical protein